MDLPLLEFLRSSARGGWSAELVLRVDAEGFIVEQKTHKFLGANWENLTPERLRGALSSRRGRVPAEVANELLRQLRSLEWPVPQRPRLKMVDGGDSIVIFRPTGEDERKLDVLRDRPPTKFREVEGRLVEEPDAWTFFREWYEQAWESLCACLEGPDPLNDSP